MQVEVHQGDHVVGDVIEQVVAVNQLEDVLVAESGGGREMV